MSLNSVVNSLVRAAAGVPADISDTDLDRHVAELLAREAKDRDAKWEALGLGGLMDSRGRDSPDPSAPKPNKRFLASVIRTVDGHNSALLRAQADAARAAQKDLRDAAGPSSYGGRHGEPSRSGANRLFGGALRSLDPRGDRNGRERRDRHNAESQFDRDDRRCRETSHEIKGRGWSGGLQSDRYDDGDAPELSRREKSDRRGRFRDGEDGRDERTRATRHEESDEESESRRHYRRDRSRSRERDTQRRRARESVSPQARGKERVRDGRSSRGHRRRADRSGSDDDQDITGRRQESSRDSERRVSSRRRRDRSTSTEIERDTRNSNRGHRNEPSSSRKERSRPPRPPSPPSAKPPSPPPPPRSPSPTIGPPAAKLSKMDKYFSEAYDPRLDLPEVPSEGMITAVGWDNMLAVLKERGQMRSRRHLSPGLSDTDPYDVPRGVHIRSPSPDTQRSSRKYLSSSQIDKLDKKKRKEERKRRAEADGRGGDALLSEDERDRRRRDRNASATAMMEGEMAEVTGMQYVRKGGTREWDKGK